MINFDTVWEKICNDYVEDYGNINYNIVEKGYLNSNRPKTLYIEISEEDYENNLEKNPFGDITAWLYNNAKAHKITHLHEEYNFDDFDVIIDITEE